MASPVQTSALLRRALVSVVIGVVVVLVAREMQKGQEAPSGPGAPEATARAGDEALAELIPELVAALGQRDTTFLLDHVATSFKEERGLDYYDVRTLFEMAAASEPPVRARLDGLELTPVGDGREVASARISFARGLPIAPDAPLPAGAVTYAVEAVFAKDGPRWVALTGIYRRESPPAATTPATPPTTTR